MTDTMFEEAKRCPRCEKPGTLTYTESLPKGAKAHTYSCYTEGCRWEGTGWIVQVNADGSIPIREKGEKQFEKLGSGATSYAESVLNKTQAELMEGETSG